MIYLDNAATTFPKPDIVYEAMDSMSRNAAVNAGRGSYRLAREASKLVAETKQLLREMLQLDISASVVFTPSVTIAMNQIVNGLRLRDNATVYLSPYEHNAVARPVFQLSKNKKVQIKELPIKLETLEIDLEKMKYEFSKDKPDVVICTHISNVTGYVLPVEEYKYLPGNYIQVCSNGNIYLLVPAEQGVEVRKVVLSETPASNMDAIAEQVETPAADLLLSGQLCAGQTLRLELREGRLHPVVCAPAPSPFSTD